MRALVFLVKLLLKIAVAPVIVALTLFVWICVGIVYISGLVRMVKIKTINQMAMIVQMRNRAQFT